LWWRKPNPIGKTDVNYEADDSLHLGRLLVLIDVFAGRRGDQTIDGITKLADFLLRYPSYLERALLARNAPEAAARVEEFERNSVEARMVRYKFGPWDYRYRRFLKSHRRPLGEPWLAPPSRRDIDNDQILNGGMAEILNYGY
jgi:hypothetical protein